MSSDEPKPVPDRANDPEMTRWRLHEEWPRFSHHAMATFYEIIIRNVELKYAEQAAQAVFMEIDRLEEILSRFRPNSDVSRINALKKFEEIIIDADAFACLQLASDIYQHTRGAFDVSAGRLIGLFKEEDSPPDASAIDRARATVGMPWLKLEEEFHRVTLMNDAIDIDLGGIGKGYAIDKAADILREWEIPSALIHGGTSTVLAYDMKDMEWPVTILGGLPAHSPPLQIELNNRALSGSGLQKGSHIVDPRSAKAVRQRRAAWALAGNATLADALSTAFMVMANSEITDYFTRNHDCGGLLLNKEGELQKMGSFPAIRIE